MLARTRAPPLQTRAPRATRDNPALGIWRLSRARNNRHTFAVHALLRWYRAGADVQAKLPLLATYMGHVSIASTQYYLPFVEALAAAAATRFADRCGRLLETAGAPGGAP